MADEERSYYTLLGIGRDASAAEIDRAYRRAARATHPDRNPDDSSAAERFRAVTVAYETLRSPERRTSYDRAHEPLRSSVPVTVVRRRRPAAGVAPVQIGRRPPRTYSTVVGPARDDLFDVFATLSRLLDTLGSR